jgi:hypothetical protein
MNKQIGSRVLRSGVMLAFIGAAIGGCGATVSPRLPTTPQVSSVRAPLKVAVVGNAADTPLVTEVRGLLNSLGSVDQRTIGNGDDLNTFCTLGYDLVARAGSGRTGFSSNAAERNTLIIYESVVVVGLPVALISAATWPWYGELTADGELETCWCGDGTPVHTRAFTSIRADGRGFISQGRLQNELQSHVNVALARAIVDAAARCGRFEKGGDQCSGETP